MQLQKKLRLLCIMILFLISNMLYAETYEVFMGFEKEGEWNIFGNASASSKFHFITAEGPDSINIFLGKLEYGFQTPGNDYVEIVLPMDISKSINKYRIWVNGDKKEALLKMLFQDENEEIFVIMLGKINWYGWKQLEGDFSFEDSYGGDDNGIMDGKIRFYGFMLEDDPNDQIIGGAILFKDLEFSYKLTSMEMEETEKAQSIRDKEEVQIEMEKKRGVFFSGLVSMTFDDVDTKGKTNVNQYDEKWERKSLLHQYFDLMIHGQLYDEGSVDAKIRIEKGHLGWISDRKEDYYNDNYTRGGFELEKMVVKGKPFGFYNTLTVGKINPVFTSYALSKTLYGAQWEVEKGFFKSIIVGARPESSIQDKGGLYTKDTDYNVYLMGIREIFQVGTMQVAGSIVNIHRNDGQISTAKNFVRGHNEAPTAALYFKLSDNSPEDDMGGELIDIKFYEQGTLKYDIIPNNNEEKVLLKESGDTGTWSGYRWTKGDSYFIYKFALKNGADTVEILANMQGNYRAEISIDGINWYPVLVSPTDVRDQSNTGIRKIKIISGGAVYIVNNVGGSYVDSGYKMNLKEAHDGYASSGKTILGFDMTGKIFDTDMTFEYNTIYEHRIYIGHKREDVNLGYAAYLNISRNIDWAFLKGELYDISHKYNTTFSEVDVIEDNDDNDEWPDNWTGEIVRFVDENRNSIPDNEERPPYRKVGLYIIDDYFDHIVDKDHNDVRDDRENDDLPDYKYKINQVGYILKGNFNIVRYLSLLAGYKDVKAKRGGAYDQEIMTGFEFSRPLTGNRGDIRLIDQCRKIRDTIADDIVSYSDNLYYKNSLVNNLSVFINYRFFEKLMVRSKHQYILKGSDYRKTVQNAESVVELRREFPIVYKLSLTPLFFSRINKDISETRSPAVLNSIQIKRNLSDHRGILELAYQLSSFSKIFMAGQYGYYKTLFYPLYKYYVTTFVLGAQGMDISSVQYGIEYRREKYDYDTKGLNNAFVSSFYAHVSYRF